MKTATEKHQAIARAVVTHYIETGNGCDVKQIAASIGRSESWVRRWIYHGGGPRSVTPRKEERITYSRDYPGMEHGSRSVWMYYPTMAILREIVRRSNDAESVSKTVDDREAR